MLKKSPTQQEILKKAGATRDAKMTLGQQKMLKEPSASIRSREAVAGYMGLPARPAKPVLGLITIC
jgi:hypothetical protein